MGFVTDADLRRPPRDPFESRPVGAMAGQYKGTATLLVRQAGGTWNYGEELGIDIVPNACFELPFEDFRLLYWSGIEITLRIKDLRETFGDPGGRKAEQYFVVAALEPVTWGWTICALLRGENKHAKVEERNEAIRDWVKAGCPMQELTKDPFLRDKGKYVARLNDPMRLHYENGRNLKNGFVIGREPPGIEKAVWHFGICPAACLRHFGLMEQAIPSSPTFVVRPGTGTVRAPRTGPADLAQAAALYALAGRAEEDPITFQQMQAKAEKALAKLGEVA
jgi:hypothetical protein